MSRHEGPLLISIGKRVQGKGPSRAPGVAIVARSGVEWHIFMQRWIRAAAERRWFGDRRMVFAVLLLCLPGVGSAQSGMTGQPAGVQAAQSQPAQAVPAAQVPEPSTAAMRSRMISVEGRTVVSMEFQGVSLTHLTPVPSQLAEQAGAALSADKVRASLRRLYATGQFDSLSASVREQGDGVALIFAGRPRTFIGMVTVDGAKGANINSMLLRTSRLNPGERFTPSSLTQAEAQMRRVLAENGFRQPTFQHVLTPHPDDQLVDIAYTVASGVQARTGKVAIEGESGLSDDAVRHYAHLEPGKKVGRDTASKALGGLENYYRKEQRLEAEVKLAQPQYDAGTHHLDWQVTANRGPVVKVQVEGVNLSEDRIRKLVPVYEEGAVDEDLLNEGNRNLQNYFQRLGYFDAKVSHKQAVPSGEEVQIVYEVKLGARHRVRQVSITGAHYFDQPTLRDLLSVRAGDAFERQGVYNQSLVAADVAALQAIYQNNGFWKVQVTPEIVDADDQGQSPLRVKVVGLTVVYHIAEGQQQRVHSVQLVGGIDNSSAKLAGMLNTVAGQPLSPQNLAGDRETMLTWYLSRGYEQARVELTQTEQPKDPSEVDVVFHIAEGEQIFLRRVLITGLHSTRPDTISRAITLHDGDPLDQTALLTTQRNLYDLALFNEVNTAIQNPTGEEPQKTVLLQLSEARRWDVSYGFGFEAQTGTVSGGTSSNPNGRVGASPRGLLEVSRINLFGRDQTASLRGTLGLLEQRVNLLYQYPHFFGSPNFGFSLSRGYNNSQDVTTYSASKLEGSVRLTEHFSGDQSGLSKANTLIYQFIYRRVKVNANSVEVPAIDIPLVSQAVRVGGPAFTWIRDTRDTPLDAHRGTYTSFQEFLSSAVFSSQANFNQVDVSNSSYYLIGKNKIVLARNTRYGQERAYGTAGDELIPLPERLYGGGANSHRGFGVNSAGPRDPQTGYPIGGAGVFVNSTELRLPAPTLPFVGNSLSFVPFHDMGNVFTNASDIWASLLRFRQQNRTGCRDLTAGAPTGPSTSTGQQGTCSFNYFSHAVGLGLRYRTPVGPIRVDFSYNLNPPIYPVTYDAVNKINLAKPYVGEGAHFNFFFSLGQSF